MTDQLSAGAPATPTASAGSLPLSSSNGTPADRSELEARHEPPELGPELARLEAKIDRCLELAEAMAAGLAQVSELTTGLMSGGGSKMMARLLGLPKDPPADGM